MYLRTKSLLITFLGTLAFAVLISAVAIYAFTTSTETGLKLQSQMAAELIRMTITHEMDEGSPDHMRPYMRNLVNVPGLKHAHIVPAESVLKQFQLDPKSYDLSDALEKKVFETGKDAQELKDGDTPLFHYALPYTARASQNCLNCHEGTDGDVLGVVSIEIDMSRQRHALMLSIAGMLLLFLLFGLAMNYLLRRLLRPVINTTNELRHVVQMAEAGDFSARLSKRSDDEVGEIAEQTNHFMQTLETSFGGISQQVETLTGTYQSDEKNLLNRTAEVVNNLVGAAHFKQSIENDRDLEEVYGRLAKVLKRQFGFNRFSIYEVSNSKNRIQLIRAEGLPEGAELWCDREITVNCDTCRAKRTGQSLSSMDEEDICSAFRGNQVQDADALFHTCIPFMLSGAVGGVVQILFSKEEAKHVNGQISMLRTYLAEAAPVIETKRLMLSLKEQSMRDPMTNLYNRRFLEDYLDTMLATAARQNAGIGILMCDVDFFKQVNDSLGHEVGDEVLVTVSRIITQSIRGSDLAIRFGGEEFVALLVGADEAKAMEVAERVRKAMEDYTFKTANGPLKKTISVGVSEFPQDSDAFWECLKFADVAMYQAKETGRNKVLRFSKEMWKEGQSY
ncbi:MAG: hypothetical protein CO187_01755 [Zetaproteobacteria bacterium CG_4_9_14_3_um_filter_53_7]|nr:MAG: hypothetical protein CO187_01755 [Zetaproteobacteria bacterium CG_4_9_14_3_um_filter_53_7]